MGKKGVFIIESLKRKEEEVEEYYEGKLLKKILFLGSIRTEYKYVRSISDLQSAVIEFNESKFRYLHFVCHGNSDSFELTNEPIDFDRFSRILSPYLKNKRLFISSCHATNDNLAHSIFSKVSCYSIIGPYKRVYMDDIAMVWASFYHLALKNEKIKRENIIKIFKTVCKLFSLPLNYYSSSRSNKYGFKLTPLIS